MATGSNDANGIWKYGADDPRTPFQDTLNLLATSISTVVSTLKSRITAIENLLATSASGTPLTPASGFTVATNRGIKKGGVAYIDFRFTTNGVLTVGGTGSVGVKVADFAAGWAAATPAVYGMSSYGRVATAYLQTGVNGMQLVAVVPGTTIPAGTQFAFTAVYPLG